MMASIPPGKLIARVAAGAVFTIASGYSSASLDKFASWCLAAFGAGLALTVSNLKEISAFIPVAAITSGAYLFLVAAALCVAQRYLATVIVSGAKSAKEGRTMGEKLEHMDGEEFIAQMKAGLPWPLRSMCAGMLDAVAKGDYAAGGRFFMRLTLLQGSLVGLEIAALMVALTRIVSEMKL